MRRVVLYIRVSTREQAEHGYSIEMQKERLLAYCKAMGWLVVGIYIDPGHSGASLDRPDMQRLIADKDKHDIVLVYKLDRLSRSQKDTLFLIEEIFLKNGIDFVSVMENIDTSTPYGRAMIGILSAFAQLEREQIKERMLLGKTGRAKKGLFHGGKNLPIGYDRVNGRLVINEYEAMQIRKIYDMYLEGYGLSYINKYMHDNFRHKQGDWKHIKTIIKVLENNVYIGTIKFRGEEIPDSHEPIIAKEKFEAVQKLRQKRHVTIPRNDSLLVGFIYCHNCGSRMFSSHYSRNNQSYYCCHSAAGNNLSMIKDPDCDMPWVRQKLLEAMVDYEIRKIAFDNKIISKIANQKQKKVVPSSEPIKNRITAIDKEIQKFMELYRFDNIPANIIAEKITEFHEEKTMLEAQIIEENIQNPEFDKEALSAMLANTALVWDLADTQQKRHLMKALIKRIIVEPNKINIEWTF